MVNLTRLEPRQLHIDHSINRTLAHLNFMQLESGMIERGERLLFCSDKVVK